MLYSNEQRIVLTLDAGGTNLNFNAVQANRELLQTVNIPADHQSIEKTLKDIIKGFREVQKKIKSKASAISFSFPGPADYENGIIGDLENLPEFRGGIALKAMLENEFGVPVFINNDGDLFTYGESIAGLLPEINQKLKATGSEKQYKNLLGVTFGTGFGAGIVSDGQLFRGDNSAAAEINRMQNILHLQTSIEDSCSIRAIKRVYAETAKIDYSLAPEPFEIYRIAKGESSGNHEAAISSFEVFAGATAYALTNAVTLVDAMIVIGGGLSGAHSLFLDKIVRQMNRKYISLNRQSFPHLEIDVFNLENPDGLKDFLADRTVDIPVPFSDNKIKYDPEKKTGIGISRLGTSNAVSIGAYAFALNELDK